MRISKWNVNRLKYKRVEHLPPVGVNHVRCCRHHRGFPELGHDLTTAESSLCAYRVFTVSEAFLQLRGNLQCFLEAPATIRVKVNAGIRERLFDGLYCFEFFFRRQYSTLELEVLKSVLLVRCFCECNDLLRRECFLVAKSVPVAGRIGFFLVREVCLLPVANVEQVAEESHTLPLYSVAHQCRRRNIEEFTHEVKQRCFNRRNHMNARPQIERLKSANVVLYVSVEPFANVVECSLVVSKPRSYNKMLDVLESLRDFLAAGNFTAAEISV